MAYFDVEGREITFSEWAPKLIDEEYRSIATTTIQGATPDGQDALLVVHTHWIGLNRGISSGPIKIFESAVAADRTQVFLTRYSTRDEARAGHARIVWSIYAGHGPSVDVPDNATCITCQLQPVRERFRAGAWTCLECQVEVNAGSLLHPIPRITA